MSNINEIIPEFGQKCEQLRLNTQYGFTRREAEILILSCYGFDVETIAQLMHRSPKTILKHRENAKQKTPFSTLMSFATFIWPLINN